MAWFDRPAAPLSATHARPPACRPTLRRSCPCCPAPRRGRSARPAEPRRSQMRPRARKAWSSYLPIRIHHRAPAEAAIAGSGPMALDVGRPRLVVVPAIAPVVPAIVPVIAPVLPTVVPVVPERDADAEIGPVVPGEPFGAFRCRGGLAVGDRDVRHRVANGGKPFADPRCLRVDGRPTRRIRPA